MNENKCEAGCQIFTGGEKRHVKECVFYPESLTKIYDDLKELNGELLKVVIDHYKLVSCLKITTPTEKLIKLIEKATNQKIEDLV